MQTADERLHVHYTLTRDDYTTAAGYATRRLMQSASQGWLTYILTLVGAICGGVIGFGYLELANGYHGPSPQWAWWVAVAFVIAWISTVWQQRFRAKRILSVMVADDGAVLGPQDLTVTPEALIHHHRGATTQISWSALRSIEEKDNNVLVFIDNCAFYAVPCRAFANTDERSAWINTLRARSSAVSALVSEETTVSEAFSSVAPPMPASMPPSNGPTIVRGLFRNFLSGVRLAFLQRIKHEDLVVTAESFAVLVVANLTALFLLGFAGTGVNGQFNYYELPRALLPVPLLLVFGLLVARANGEPKAMLILAVALMAAGTTITVIMGTLGLLMQHQIAAGLARHLWMYIYYFTFAWWAVVIAATILRLTSTNLRRRTSNIVFGLILLVVPVWLFPQGYLWMPAYDPDSSGRRSSFSALAEEKGFYAQHEALSRALAGLQSERPGIVDLYLVAAGLYAHEDVFMKEVGVIDRLFRERFDAEGRTLMLINNPKTVKEHPVASLTSLSTALRHIGKLINPEEDVVVLYVSSHGSEKHRLSVDFWPLRLESIDPPALKRAFAESGIKWKVVVISACYSGGFVDPLKDEHTVVITASSASKQSFGCGNESEATYLAKALFDEELRKTYSFETAFENARKSIEQRERGQGHTPSEPQIHVGSAIRDKLAVIERRLATRGTAPSN